MKKWERLMLYGMTILSTGMAVFLGYDKMKEHHDFEFITTRGLEVRIVEGKSSVSLTSQSHEGALMVWG